MEIHAGDSDCMVYRYSEGRSIMDEYGIDAVINAASYLSPDVTYLISGKQHRPNELILKISRAEIAYPEHIMGASYHATKAI